MLNQQLALAIHLNDEATLADYCWAGNLLLAQQIEYSLSGQGERFLFLWGPNGCGKSHLLQACCAATLTSQTAIYLPLQMLKEWGADSIDGLDSHNLVAIDDIEQVALDKAWEEQLFHLYNRLRDNGQTLIISASCPPAQLKIGLADLRSRLCSGLTIQIHELSDEEKINTLMARAHQRGFVLSTAVAQFLVTRNVRNMHDLTEILNRLDEASLAAQRKITIPFVKETLGL